MTNYTLIHEHSFGTDLYRFSSDKEDLSDSIFEDGDVSDDLQEVINQLSIEWEGKPQDKITLEIEQSRKSVIFSKATT